MGAIAVRFAMTARAGELAAADGSAPSPATTTVSIPEAPNVCPAHGKPDPVLVSQILVGLIGWYCAPVPAVALPNQPFASRSTLIVPVALYTQTDVPVPPDCAGPSCTISLFARTSPAARFSV